MNAIKSGAPTPAQLGYRKALEDAMSAHGATLDAAELLAVTAHLVGQLVALQDQRVMTPAKAMALVSSNLQQGNLEVLERLMEETGGTA